MPRFVRNWWIEVETDDGRKVAAGPSRSDGGVYVTVFQRDLGSVTHSFRLRGYVAGDKSIVMEVIGPDGEIIAEHMTKK